MYEYDEDCLKAFLQGQSRLFGRDHGRGGSVFGGLHGGCC